MLTEGILVVRMIHLGRPLVLPGCWGGLALCSLGERTHSSVRLSVGWDGNNACPTSTRTGGYLHRRRLSVSATGNVGACTWGLFWGGAYTKSSCSVAQWSDLGCQSQVPLELSTQLEHFLSSVTLSDLIALSLSFLVCKMGMIIVPPHKFARGTKIN